MERAHLSESLETPRLRLKRVHTVVSAETRAVIEAERPRFLAYFPSLDPKLSSADLMRDFTRECEELWSRFEEYAYELRAREDGRFIGHASVHALAFKHECAELAYWVRSEAEGKGYVSEAVTGLEQYLFGRGFHRVEIRCDTLNVASKKVAERCGYTLDGTLRQHMKRRDGTYRDSYVFGKLAQEAGQRTSDGAKK